MRGLTYTLTMLEKNLHCTALGITKLHKITKLIKQSYNRSSSCVGTVCVQGGYEKNTIFFLSSIHIINNVQGSNRCLFLMFKG